ncbi:MAG: hypothetical protein ACI4XL_12800 [Bacillus sp. (in: firmicutes)]
MVVLGVIILGFIAFRIYRYQEEKPAVWRIIAVVLIGLFSFSIQIPFFGQMLKVAVLPLGVWILLSFLRRHSDRWQVYRRFAWLGFLGNYLFLGLSMLAMLFYALIYDKDDPSTYIADAENASLVITHPSAGNYSLDTAVLTEQIPNMKQAGSDAALWYEEAVIDTAESKEQFPYLITGLKPKWGSGVHASIFVEEDGKGLLITTSSEQIHLRSEVSLLKGGE